MPTSSPEQRLRVLAMVEGFKTAKDYITMLEHLVPEHYDYKKTIEYKNWQKTKSYVFLRWCKWKSI